MKDNVIEKSSKFAKPLLFMTIFVVISKLFGLLRDTTLAYCYGTSNISDAFVVAFSIPSILFAAFGTAISTVFVPVYLEKDDLDRKNNTNFAKSFLFKILFFGSLACIILICLIQFFPSIVITVFASGFTKETMKICTDILRIGCFSIFFLMLTSVFSSIALTKRKYIATSVISLPLNIILIISMVLSLKMSYVVLGYGILLAFASEAILLLIFVRKNAFKIKPSLKLDRDDKKVFFMVLPVFLGSAVSQVNHIVDKSIASTFGAGNISALNYASTINVAVQELLLTAFLSVMFAEFSRQLIDKDVKELKNETESIFSFVRFVLIPITFFVMFFSKPIVKILYFRGTFDENSLGLTCTTLVFYSISIFFVSMRDVLSKLFHSNKNTLAPTISAIIAISLNVGLNFLLGKLMGVYGIALATSIASFVAMIILLIWVNVKYFKIDFKNHILDICKISFLTLICVTTSLAVYNGLCSFNINYIVSFVISFIIFALLVILLFKILNDERLKSLLSVIFKRKSA